MSRLVPIQRNTDRGPCMKQVFTAPAPFAVSHEPHNSVMTVCTFWYHQWVARKGAKRHRQLIPCVWRWGCNTAKKCCLFLLTLLYDSWDLLNLSSLKTCSEHEVSKSSLSGDSAGNSVSLSSISDGLPSSSTTADSTKTQCRRTEVCTEAIDWQVPLLSSEVPAFSLRDFNGRPYWMSGLVLWFHVMSALLLVSLLERITDHLTLTAKACTYVCQNKCSCFQLSLMNKQGTEWRKWDLVHPYSAMRTHRNYRDVRKYKTSIKSSSLSRQWRDQIYASMQRN